MSETVSGRDPDSVHVHRPVVAGRRIDHVGGGGHVDDVRYARAGAFVQGHGHQVDGRGTRRQVELVAQIARALLRARDPILGEAAPDGAAQAVGQRVFDRGADHRGRTRVRHRDHVGRLVADPSEGGPAVAYEHGKVGMSEGALTARGRGRERRRDETRGHPADEDRADSPNRLSATAQLRVHASLPRRPSCLAVPRGNLGASAAQVDKWRILRVFRSAARVTVPGEFGCPSVPRAGFRFDRDGSPC